MTKILGVDQRQYWGWGFAAGHPWLVYSRGALQPGHSDPDFANGHATVTGHSTRAEAREEVKRYPLLKSTIRRG